MDIPSLFLIQGIILMLFGVTMLIDAVGQHSQEGNYWFAASNFCGAIGLLLRRVLPDAPAWVTMLLPNFLLFLELALMYKAVAVFLHRGQRGWPWLLGLSVGAAGLSAYGMHRQNNTLIADSISVVLVVSAGSVAFLLFRYARPRLRVSMYSMGTLLVLYAGNNLHRLSFDWTDPRARFYHILFDRTILAGLSVSYLLMSEAALRHRLVEMATLDPLTGAFNRRAFEREATLLIAGARRAARPVSALMIDVDQFKQINDTYGHAAGDDTLQAIGGLLKASLRDSDLVVRLGGDEFFVLLSGANTAQAADKAARLRNQVADLRIPHPGGDFPVSISVGVAELDGASFALDELMKASDDHLYAMKAARRLVDTRAA